MKTYLLPENGNFYKTNLHCHTTVSDGVMTPEEVKEAYLQKGYSAVCFTDHEILVGHEDLCDDRFIALHGYEVSVKKFPTEHTGNFQPVYHFNLIAEDQKNLVMPLYNLNASNIGNSREWFRKVGQYDASNAVEEVRYDVDWLNRYIEAVTKAGFLVTYNHPMWSLQTMRDYAGLRGLCGFETFNGGCFPNNDNTSIHFEIMLRRGVDVLPIAGDDNHQRDECGLCFTMIKAPELSYRALIDAYKKGDCYASEGPQISELSFEDGMFCVRTDTPCTVTMFTEGRELRYEENTECAHLKFRPEVCGRFVRFEVRDAHGKQAFTRAYHTENFLGSDT